MKVKFTQVEALEDVSQCWECAILECNNDAENIAHVELTEADYYWDYLQYSNKNFAWVIPVCQSCVNKKEQVYKLGSGKKPEKKIDN